MSNTNIYQVNQSFLNDIQEKLADDSLTAEQKALLIAGVSKLQQNVDLQSIVTGIMQEGVTEVTDQNQAASTAITTAVGEATTALTDATASIEQDVGNIRRTLPYHALRVGPNLKQAYMSGGNGTTAVIPSFADEIQNRFYVANTKSNTTNKLNVNFGYYDADDNWVQLCNTALTGDMGTDFHLSGGMILPLKESKDSDNTIVCVVFFTGSNVYILREDFTTRLFGITACKTPYSHMAYDKNKQCLVLFGDSDDYGGDEDSNLLAYANGTLDFDPKYNVNSESAWRNTFYYQATAANYIPLRMIDNSFKGLTSFHGYNITYPPSNGTLLAPLDKYLSFKKTHGLREHYVGSFYNCYLSLNSEGLSIKWFEFIADIDYIPQYYGQYHNKVLWKATKAILLDEQQKPLSAVYINNDLPRQYDPYTHGVTYLEPIGMLPGTPNRIFSRTALTTKEYFCNVHHY